MKMEEINELVNENNKLKLEVEKYKKENESLRQENVKLKKLLYKKLITIESEDTKKTMPRPLVNMIKTNKKEYPDLTETVTICCKISDKDRKLEKNKLRKTIAVGKINDDKKNNKVQENVDKNSQVVKTGQQTTKKEVQKEKVYPKMTDNYSFSFLTEEMLKDLNKKK